MHPIMRILVREGVIDEARAAELDESFSGDVHPVEHWVNEGVSEDVIADCLSAALRIPRIDIVRVGDDVAELISDEVVRMRLCIPVQLESSRKLILAMVDPTDVDTIDEVRFATNLAVEPRVISLGKFWEVFSREYDGIDDPPIVRLVNLLLVDMIKQGDDSLLLDQTYFEQFPGLEALESRDAIYTRVVERLREMGVVTAGVSAFAACVLRVGDELGFFCFDFRSDDSETVIRRLSRDAFEQAFGHIDE